MAVRFLIPGFLRVHTGGHAMVEIASAPETVAEALDILWQRHPGVRDRVLTEQGEVRPHVNVFVGVENIRHTGGLATPTPPGAEITIVPAVSGG